ncbi:MAG: phosphatidylserine decarboxylase [Victivallales bacterium]|nr:phosphatidylserine decarboxylase [Victivallales bacterium]
MKLTKYGLREWGGSGIIAVIVIILGAFVAMKWNYAAGITLAVLAAVIWLALAAFFRVPHRIIPADPRLILAPADGVIRDIELIAGNDLDFPAGHDMIRIGIFLSVLDVHLNRAPADMTVQYKKYRAGRYLDARHSRASKENEAMLLAGEAEIAGRRFPIGVRQISGAIARRIVCPVEPECRLERGAVYGMIKFGSRTELYLPAATECSVRVKIGDRVYAGTSVMAEYHPAPEQ